MKQLILFVLLLLCFVSASATHHRGSYITFKYDTTANPIPRRLFFTLTTFTDRASQADSPEVEIKMGDGNNIIVQRRSITPVGALSSLVDKEVYIWEYTYASDGIYTVSHVIINRNPGLLNMTPPSDQSPIYRQTTVTINGSVGFNSSPQFLSPMPVFASIGKAVNYNFLAHDSDGDSLAFKLITPKAIDKSGNVIPVTGYTLPDQTFKCSNSTYSGDAEFNLSELDGQFTWDAPCRKGEYIYAVAIEEWRDGTMISEIEYEMQILVIDSGDSWLELIKTENQKYSTEGYLIVKATDEVKFQMRYNYMKPDEYYVTGKGNYFTSELSHVLKVPVTYDIDYHGVKGTFAFKPDKSLIRNRPYFVNFYGTDGRYSYTKSIGIIIRDDQPIIKLEGQNKYTKTDEGYYIFLATNTVKLSMFAENMDGYVQELSVESALAAKAEKFNFTVRDTTEGKVGELIFKPSVYQTTYNPQAITFKATYNPARMAGQRASYAGAPIVKEMQVQVIVTQQLPTATAEELAVATYLIYPNPAQDKFTVQAEAPATLRIYSLQGKLLLEQQLQPGTTEIRRPGTTTSGLYFYSLTTKSGHKQTGKLVLQ
ncbi:T9SS type A sorting domain-containing protein [Pontibacter pudoricolor]|uniref:T9SS type A sorting domain-containing protein n=1 Tax=Pontibacter pudoricolor TaxID=2694930 RepID=UPI00139173DA|nr:T9SS type A sorting domain-containing protein [Pontibacter pudoricolor]